MTEFIMLTGHAYCRSSKSKMRFVSKFIMRYLPARMPD